MADLLGLYEQMAVIRGTEKAAHDLFLAGLVKGTTTSPPDRRRSRSERARPCVQTTMSSPPTAGTITRLPAAPHPSHASPS
jgi:hypothetical protein